VIACLKPLGAKVRSPLKNSWCRKALALSKLLIQKCARLVKTLGTKSTVLYIKGWRLFFYSNEGVDGQTYDFPLVEISQKLANANEKERTAYQISPSGYGIHWPLIDEDLSINGLLKTAEKLAISGVK
jgi:hypothetical protein